MRESSLFHPHPLDPRDLKGRRVTVMGLGLFGGGLGLTEFLCHWGAQVTVTDLASEEKLASSLAALQNLPLRFVLGKHREEDFLGADLVFVNPAVPPHAPLLEVCRNRGIPLETEMNLFFKLCPARICGVTGSNGKTTTTRLLGEIVAGEFPRTRMGGNLGRSLLDGAVSMRPSDWVILELSSFQLEELASIRRRPEVALITNLSPNHLDWHGTYERYVGSKKVILDPPESGGWSILCGDDSRLRSWGGLPGRRTAYYGRSSSVLPRARGVWITQEGEVVSRGIGGETGHDPLPLFKKSDLKLLGRFNLINAAGSACAALILGASPGAVLQGVRKFRAVGHRLDLVHSEGGVEFYNDSIATTPESTICALEALGPRVILLAGGSDKGSSFTGLARVIARRTKAVVLMGKTAPAIQNALKDARASIPIHLESNLNEAVERARSLAAPGDRILLSPACASYDMFVNFEDRGNQFTRIVRKENNCLNS